MPKHDKDTQLFHHLATYRSHEIGVADIDEFHTGVVEAIQGIVTKKSWTLLDFSAHEGIVRLLIGGKEPKGCAGEEVAIALDTAVSVRFPLNNPPPDLPTELH